MTPQTKWVTAAGLALGLGLGLMLAMHFYGAYSFFGGHPMHAMWGGMGWMMQLGPVLMLLCFGGALALLVAVAQWLSR